MARIRRILFRGPAASIRILWQFASGMFLRLLEIAGQVFPEAPWGCKVRGAIYRPFLKQCGKNFQVALHAKLECAQQISVEDDVYIGHGCWINGSGGGIHFESEAMLGPYVTMVSGNHGFENGSARFSQSGQSGPILIGFGSWLASHSVVTSGVTIGKGCLVAAGAVVTKDTEEGSIVAGVPAKPRHQTAPTGEVR